MNQMTGHKPDDHKTGGHEPGDHETGGYEPADDGHRKRVHCRQT